MIPAVIGAWGLAVVVGFFLWMAFINFYIFIWAMGEWGVIDLAWADEFVATWWSWTKDFLFLDLFNDLLAIPFEQLKFVLTKVSPDDEGYHLLFVMTVYPGLYLFVEQFAIPNIFVVPWIGFMYVVASSLFYDEQKTDENGNEYLVPSSGLPAWWAAFYAINSVCWGDYRYLDLEKPLEINFVQFLQIWFWSFWLIGTAPLTLFPYLAWSLLGNFALFTIFWYEVAFLSFSDNRKTAEEEGAPTLSDEIIDEEWL